MIPDIVVVEDGNLSIYDAKYYKITLDNEKVEKQPGVQDVAKQYLYELSFKKIAAENNFRIVRNAFLLPSDHSESKTIGTVKLDLMTDLDDIQVKEIEIILFPAREAFNSYLFGNNIEI